LDPAGPTSAHDEGAMTEGDGQKALPTGPIAYDGVPTKRSIGAELKGWLRDYFVGEEPTFGIALVPMCFLSMILFTRHPLKTNFIFDEQEALLANPYVRSVADPASKLHWIDAFYRDFWGLAADRSIGSYRPVPDLVWRALWANRCARVAVFAPLGERAPPRRERRARGRAGREDDAEPARVVAVRHPVRRQRDRDRSGERRGRDRRRAGRPRRAPGAAGAAPPDVGHAVRRLRGDAVRSLLQGERALLRAAGAAGRAVLGAEPPPRASASWARATLAFVATAAAFVFYVEARRRCFPAPIAAELSIEANANKPLVQRTFATMLRWYAQPSLPKDPLNNPLIDATPPFASPAACACTRAGFFR